jgi:hypothetical protein
MNSANCQTLTCTMKNSCVCTWLLCGFTFLSKNAAGYFATNTTVLLAQAKGAIPYAYGPVKATVSAGKVLTLDFSIVAGTGYAAGAVRATIDSNGRVFRLAKQKQACTITYNRAGSIGSVTCTGARRLLTDSELAATESDVNQDAERASGNMGTGNQKAGLLSRRNLASLPCASCVSLVYSAFKSRIRSICGSPFSRLIPTQYRWPKTVAAALCGMTTSTRLGDPTDLANRTCRCCTKNSGCPSGVCSAEVCLAGKLQRGAPCPDFEDGDCENNRCALDSYPSGKHVCCLNDSYIPPPDNVTFEHYCTAIQEVDSPCSRNEMCKSQVCSGGVCIAQKISVNQGCPDGEDDDCQNGVCARGSAGEYVCCPSGQKDYDSISSDFYCTSTTSCEGDWPDPGPIDAQSCNQWCDTGGVNGVGRFYDMSTIFLSDALPGIGSYECRYEVAKAATSFEGGCKTVVPKYNDTTVVALSRYRRLSPCHIQTSWIVSSTYDRSQYGYPYVRLNWDSDYEQGSYTDGWTGSPHDFCASASGVREFHTFLCFYGDACHGALQFEVSALNNCYYMNGYNKSDPRTACLVCDYTICNGLRY